MIFWQEVKTSDVFLYWQFLHIIYTASIWSMKKTTCSSFILGAVYKNSLIELCNQSNFVVVALIRTAIRLFWGASVSIGAM